MAKITEDQVQHIADMVRIAISNDEAKQYADELRTVLDYSSKLSDLNTDEVEPTTHGIVLENALRDDEPKHSLTQEQALKNAPEKQDGHFKVPSTME